MQGESRIQVWVSKYTCSLTQQAVPHKVPGKGHQKGVQPRNQFDLAKN